MLEVTGIEETNGHSGLRSMRASPNPVASQSLVTYSLPNRAPVSCIVCDAAGNVVSRLAAGFQEAGEQQLTWNASGVRPGVYFLKLNAGGASATTRLTRVR